MPVLKRPQPRCCLRGVVAAGSYEEAGDQRGPRVEAVHSMIVSNLTCLVFRGGVR